MTYTPVAGQRVRVVIEGVVDGGRMDGTQVYVSAPDSLIENDLRLEAPTVQVTSLDADWRFTQFKPITAPPGPKPADYDWPAGSGRWITHYINHGNTWQSRDRDATSRASMSYHLFGLIPVGPRVPSAWGREDLRWPWRFLGWHR